MYSSAVIFSPKESRVRKQYLQQIPKWIATLPNVEEQWDACQQTLEGHLEEVDSVVFSPDGRLVASGSLDGTAQLWDTATGEARGTLEGHSDVVKAVVFSPDGRLVASGSRDGTVRLWDTATGKARCTLEGYESYKFEVCTVVFSPDGRLVASGSESRTVRLWDVATGKALGSLKGHLDRVYEVMFSPDGRLVASGSKDGTVRLWDVKTKETICAVGRGRYDELSFNPDGSRLIIGAKQVDTRLSASKVAHLQPSQLFSFDTTGHWISSATSNILWLPPDCRPGVCAVKNTRIVVGNGSGRMVFLSFKASSELFSCEIVGKRRKEESNVFN
jgi:WD40 repeat protein